MIDPRIRQIHDEAPLTDIHCHPPLKLYLLEEKKLHEPHDVTDEDDPLSMCTDLPSLEEGRVRVALAATHVPEKPMRDDCVFVRVAAGTIRRVGEIFSNEPDEITRRMLANFEKAIETAKQQGFSTELCRSFEEVTAANKKGNLAFVHTIEGGHSLFGTKSLLENLQDYLERGVALFTLAHFYDNGASPPVPGIPHDNCLAKAGCFRRALRTDPSLGLHSSGRDAVRFMLENGMLVDLTHSTRKARYDIYKLWQDTPAQYRRPLVISHAGLHAMAPQEMNPCWDELDLLRKTGGVIGVICMNYWHTGKTLKGEEDSMEYVVRAIDLLFDRGFEDYIAFGSDFDGFTNPPRELKEPSDIPNLTDELITRRRYPGQRYTPSQVKKFLGGNFMRVLEAGWGNKRQAAAEANKTLFLGRAPDGEIQEYLREIGCWTPATPVEGTRAFSTTTVVSKPFDLDALEQIRQELQRNPDLWRQHPPQFLPEPTALQIDRTLDYVAERLSRPAEALASFRALRSEHQPSFVLPERCRFLGYDENVPIQMSRSDMQDNDIGQWAVTWVASLWYRLWHGKFDLPRHTPANKFCYPLRESAGKATLGLFSDWGTDYYHSQYIARHLANLRPDQAVHLGDVYYAGSPDEVKDYMQRQLEFAPDLLSKFPVYLLNANHEMYHNGRPFFDFIQRKYNDNPVLQPQESTYFCLYNDHYQVIAIDTDYYEDGRYDDSNFDGWLEERLREGKAHDKINILLTQHEPYLKGTEPLLTEDLWELQSLIDLWFWGDEHGAALYDRGPQASFIGCLIGHGGYPFFRRNRNWAEPPPDVARVAWVETAARFPDHLGAEFPDVRVDVGNNGFCWVELLPDRVVLKLIDWRRQLRYHTQLAVKNGWLFLPDQPLYVGPETGTCGNPV